LVRSDPDEVTILAVTTIERRPSSLSVTRGDGVNFEFSAFLVLPRTASAQHAADGWNDGAWRTSVSRNV